MLVFGWRLATKAVDGVSGVDREIARRLAAGAAEDFGWLEDGLNDSVKGFLSVRDVGLGMKSLSGEFPSATKPGLRFFVP